MQQSKYYFAFQKLIQMPYFTVAMAREYGIPARFLSYYCDCGQLERLHRGVYRSLEAESTVNIEIEDLVLTTMSIPHGVICLISALCVYRLTDQIMREYWIAVPNSDKSPKREHAKIIRMRNMTLGLTSLQIGKLEVKIFDRERTIVDAFRLLDNEIAIKALKNYLSGVEKVDLPKLSRYAKSLKVNISPYIMALTT